METVLNYILGVAIVVFGLALSIGLHEIGHLVPAKLFGVKVTQYMIGFGPRVWSTRRGETEYGVKLLPLGGYIAMVGMYPVDPAMDDTSRKAGFFRRMIQDAREQSAEGIEAGDEQRTFSSKPVWQRIIVMLGGPTMNLLLAFVLFGVLLMGFGTPQASTTISTVSQCVIPAGSNQTECAASDPLSPAASAGFQPGDTVESVNGEQVSDWTAFTAQIAANPGTPLSVGIVRAEQPRFLTLTPQLTQRYATDATGKQLTEDGKPVLEDVGFAGLSPATEVVRGGPGEVAAAVGTSTVNIVGLVANLPQKIIDVAQSTATGGERDPDGPISVVGIGGVAGEVFSFPGAALDGRLATLIGMLASLNIALFVFNLLPLLPLDGGHVVVALWEGIRRQFARWFKRPDPGPIDAARLAPLTFVVFVLILSMSVILIWADIVNPISLFG